MRRVISYSQVTEAIEHCHVAATGHQGMDSTEWAVNERFAGINRALVRRFVKRCAVCQAKKRREFNSPLQPIVTTRKFERFLIDLIDFSRNSDGDYHYIMQ